MSGAYYNEYDAYAAEWLRNLIAVGHLPPGEVDERSLLDVRADDLKGFTQCHFFAGIGIWPHALRRAGWPDDRPVWTGSCPCQPFSAAGKQKGFEDERHLWPIWFGLIAQRRPPVVLGEQVASALGWLDLVQTDLEAAGYALGASDLCAAGFGGAHIRQRLYFVAMADTDDARPQIRGSRPDDLVGAQGWKTPERSTGLCGMGSRLADGTSDGWREERAVCRGGREGDGPEGRPTGPGARRDTGGLAPSGWPLGSLGDDSGHASRCRGDCGLSGICCGGSCCACPDNCDGNLCWLAQSDGGQRLGVADGQGRDSDGQEAGRVEGDSLVTTGVGLRGLVDADLAGSQSRGGHDPTARYRAPVAPACGTGWLADASIERRQQVPGSAPGDEAPDGRTRRDRGEQDSCDIASSHGEIHRSHAPMLGREAVDWLFCRDGKWRPVEAGTFPLAHENTARVGRLRAYGNALDAGTATAFCEVVIEALADVYDAMSLV